jgi:AcrR family transcriptional regulator
MSSSERRSAILEAAARLFEHYGHGKTTMADVAREAHVGVGTVYLEFESKEAIVRELSVTTHVGVLDAMMRAANRGADHAERLTSVLMARTESFLQLRSKGQHACELVHCKTEGVRAAHQLFHEQERALFEEILQQGQQLGTFRSVDASRTAALIQRAFASLSPPWIFSMEGDMLAVALQMCELLLRGVLAGPHLLSKGKRSDAPSDKPGRRRPSRR